MTETRPHTAARREANPPEASTLRKRTFALARRIHRLRMQIGGGARGGHVSRLLDENLLRRLEEAERDLERSGAAYFEEHCGPHLGRLQESGGDEGAA